MWRYAVIFLVFDVVLTVAILIGGDFAPGILPVIAAMVVCSAPALLVTLTMAYFHRKAVRRLPYPDALAKDGVPRKKELEIAVSLDDAIDVCTDAMRASAVQGLNVDRTSGVIWGRKPSPSLNYGEAIIINVEKISEISTAVSIISKPAFFINIVDFGRNRVNIENISKYIDDGGKL